MAIKSDSRYFGNAHRISDVQLDTTVTTLYDGQWLMMNASGKFVKHDGTTNKRGYFTISSKWGTPTDNINRPITAGRSGRDNVTSTGTATVLIGPYRVGTDQYETGSYTAGQALKVSANAKLAAWVAGTDKQEDIVGYVFVPPATAGDFLTFIHE